jgi:hypothetical protein
MTFLWLLTSQRMLFTLSHAKNPNVQQTKFQSNLGRCIGRSFLNFKTPRPMNSWACSIQYRLPIVASVSGLLRVPFPFLRISPTIILFAVVMERQHLQREMTFNAPDSELEPEFDSITFTQKLEESEFLLQFFCWSSLTKDEVTPRQNQDSPHLLTPRGFNRIVQQLEVPADSFIVQKETSG